MGNVLRCGNLWPELLSASEVFSAAGAVPQFSLGFEIVGINEPANTAALLTKSIDVTRESVRPCLNFYARSLGDTN
jgi:hypothetical protein